MSTSPPDYKELYKEAAYHLRCVSGSRNSFTPEAAKLLFSTASHATFLSCEERVAFRLRAVEVERMHQEAVNWLRTYGEL